MKTLRVKNMGPVKDAAGYTGRAAASDFPGETFRVLKEEEQSKYGPRRLVLEARNGLAEGR